MKKKLKEKYSVTQTDVKNLYGKSVKFDVYAVDDEGKSYDIEIQRSVKGAGAKRARYYSSLLDLHQMKTGKDYNGLKYLESMKRLPIKEMISYRNNQQC